MLTSSTSRLARYTTLAASALLLAACASHPASQETTSPEHVVSKYAAERTGAAASKSNAAHIPPVLHSPAAEKQAQAATGDYVMAIQAMNSKDYQKAMIIFQSIASRYPLLSGPLVNQGVIYLKQNQDKDAEQVLQQSIKVNDKNPYAWNALGITERRLGHFDAAKNAYNKALMLDPLYARAHFNLAVLADLYLDDLPLALEHYERYQTLQEQPDKSVAIWITDLKRRNGEKPPVQTAPTNQAPPAKQTAPANQTTPAAPAQNNKAGTDTAHAEKMP